MISFKQSDLDELRNSCNYLSDVIIEFYFTYLSSIHRSDSILFVPPTISYLLASFEDKKDIADCVKPLELPSKDLIFFPVNNGGMHWSLLVYSRELNVFAHHDSLSGLNNREAKELFKAVKDCVHETESFRCRLGFRNKRRRVDGPSDAHFCAELPSPRQKNGYDCGLYVMAMAKAICEWFSSGVREQTWMSEIEKVDDRVEITMRHHVLELIRDASKGRLGLVSCTIEEERRVSVSVPSSSGNIEGLTDEEILLQQFWAKFDEPTDSKATSSPSSTAVEKVIANDSQSLMEEESNNEKIQSIREEAVNDSAMVSCDSVIVEGVSSGLGREDIENVSDTPSTSSDCRTSAPNREYLTKWPSKERSSTVKIQRGSHSLLWQNLRKK